jgi:hypothetical protein
LIFTSEISGFHHNAFGFSVLWDNVLVTSNAPMPCNIPEEQRPEYGLFRQIGFMCGKSVAVIYHTVQVYQRRFLISSQKFVSHIASVISYAVNLIVHKIQDSLTFHVWYWHFMCGKFYLPNSLQCCTIIMLNEIFPVISANNGLHSINTVKYNLFLLAFAVLYGMHVK